MGIKLTMEEEYAFSAAHRIDGFTGRDERMHGHTWTIKFAVEIDADDVFDHGLLDDIAAETIGPLDHGVINDIKGLETGTNEEVLKWLVIRFEDGLWRSNLPAALKRATLGQLSSDRRFRLVNHVTTWEA